MVTAGAISYLDMLSVHESRFEGGAVAEVVGRSVDFVFFRCI